MLDPKIRFIKVLRKLKPSKFKSLNARSNDLSRNAEILYWNLWGQFGITPKMMEKNANVPDDKKLSVSDFAWTKEVEKAFYSHPKHAKFVKKLKAMRGMTWGLWALNSEPSCYEDYEQAFRRKADEVQNTGVPDPQGIGATDRVVPTDAGVVRTGTAQAKEPVKASCTDSGPGAGGRGSSRTLRDICSGCSCNTATQVRDRDNAQPVKPTEVSYADFKTVMKIAKHALMRTQICSAATMCIDPTDFEQVLQELQTKYAGME